jgi:hypothetical protein
METKLKIVETPDYILAVSDEEIKEGEIYNYGKSLFLVENILHKSGPFRHLSPKMEIQGKFLPDMKIGKFDSMTPLKKIIAYQPKGDVPELDLPLLPEMVVEDDVEKLSDEYVTDESYLPVYKEECKRAYINGYKAATKVYTEEELSGCLITLGNWIAKNGITSGIEILSKIDDIIQSLKQPKKPKYFVADMETKKGKYIGRVKIGITPSGEPTYINEGYEEVKRLKTTTINGKTYLVGTYLYE